MTTSVLGPSTGTASHSTSTEPAAARACSSRSATTPTTSPERTTLPPCEGGRLSQQRRLLCDRMAAERAEVEGDLCRVAEDHVHALDGHVELVGDELGERGPDALAEVDLPGERGDRPVALDADASLELLGLAVLPGHLVSRRLRDRSDDPRVHATAAEVRSQGVTDRVLVRRGIAGEQCGGGDEHAAGAVAALHRVLFDEGTLYRTQLSAIREALDRRDLLASGLIDGQQARRDHPATCNHEARAALAAAAAVARAGEPQVVAQHR